MEMSGKESDKCTVEKGVAAVGVHIRRDDDEIVKAVDGSTFPFPSSLILRAVPTPGEWDEHYGSSVSPDIMVRADVTYLRQDFSLLQKVADADPWPEMQRFDYLVRERVLTEKEAQAYQAEFARREATNPYRRAALAALRRLTGRDAGTTALSWRTALGMKKE
jgi:hypothetical protein